MQAHALKAPEPANEDMPSDAGAARAVREIAERFGKLGAEITDISGSIGDVTRQLEGQTDGLHRLVVAVEQVSRANRSIEQAADGAQQTASVVRSGLARVTESVKAGLNVAQSDIEALTQGASTLASALADAVGEAHKARASSDAIQSITREIQLLSINAGVEAARSGTAGRGFAVIAAAVKQLAEQTREATTTGAKQLDALVKAVDLLAHKSQENAETARRASEQSQGIALQLGELDSFGKSVVGLIGNIDAISAPTRENAVAFAEVGKDLRNLVSGVDASSANLERASQRTDQLVSISEAILGAICRQSGVLHRRSPSLSRPRWRPPRRSAGCSSRRSRGARSPWQTCSTRPTGRSKAPTRCST